MQRGSTTDAPRTQPSCTNGNRNKECGDIYKSHSERAGLFLLRLAGLKICQADCSALYPLPAPLNGTEDRLIITLGVGRVSRNGGRSTVLGSAYFNGGYELAFCLAGLM